MKAKSGAAEIDPPPPQLSRVSLSTWVAKIFIAAFYNSICYSRLSLFLQQVASEAHFLAPYKSSDSRGTL